MIIYIDENMPPHLAKGFETLQKPESAKLPEEIQVRYLPEIHGYGTKDADWIKKLGKENACVITQDINMSRKKDELELYRKNGLGMYFLRPMSKKKGLSIWQMVEALAKHWTRITEVALKEKRPFSYEFKLGGKLKKLGS